MKRSIYKIFLFVIAFALSLSVAYSSSSTARAAEKQSYLTVGEAMEWLESTVGNKRGDGQCIAFIKDYYQVLTGYVPQGNACEYAYNTLPPGFGWKRIKGEKNLKKGDILIWVNGTANNGHAAIYGGKGKYYHQKWTGLYVEVLEKSYLEGFGIRRSGSRANYWGVIRPNFRDETLFTSVTRGECKIKSCYNDKYLTKNDSASLTLKKAEGAGLKNQIFKAAKATVGYTFSSVSSSQAVGASYETGKTSKGASVKLFGSYKNDSCRWRVSAVRGGYILRNVYNPSLCLTVSRKTGKLTTEEYTGASNQKWIIEAGTSLSYNANGGRNIPKTTVADKGETHKITTETPDRNGYEFLGWAKTKTAKKATFLSGSKIKLKKNLTLFAVWKKNRIYEIESATLSSENYTYDGKVKKPSVTVRDTNGNLLREGTDYTVTYYGKRKNVGRYKVTISGKGDFEGKKSLSFTISPAATKITDLLVDGNSVIVEYKRQTKKTTGYMLEYSTKPDFPEGETSIIRIEDNSKRAKTVKNLTPDTRWYFRVRTVSETKKGEFFSRWSSIKSVRV